METGGGPCRRCPHPAVAARAQASCGRPKPARCPGTWPQCCCLTWLRCCRAAVTARWLRGTLCWALLLLQQLLPAGSLLGCRKVLMLLGMAALLLQLRMAALKACSG